MKNFSIFIKNRPDYRRLLKEFKKNPKLAAVMTHWEKRHIFIECENDGDATLLAAAIRTTLEQQEIDHQIIT